MCHLLVWLCQARPPLCWLRCLPHYWVILAAVLSSEGATGVMLLLQLLQDQADLLEALEGLFGVLDGEQGVVLLLSLGTLVHRYAGTGILHLLEL